MNSLRSYRPCAVLALVLAGIVKISAFAAAPAAPVALDKFPSFPSPSKGVRIARIATDGVTHRFFDTSPVSPSGRYVALFRFPYTDKSPVPGDAGDVLLVDLQTGKERVVAKSRGWEFQLGANVQWGVTDNELYFNDVDPSDWSAFAVKLDPLTGESRRLGGTVFMVSPDGRTLASYNLKNSRRVQVGYGVVVPDAFAKPNVGAPDDDGIFLTDTKTGATRLAVSIRALRDALPPGTVRPGEENAAFYCFQVKWNAQSDRLLTVMRWFTAPNQDRRAVVSFRPDGSEIALVVTPDQYARGGHHVNWDRDGRHVTKNLAVTNPPALDIIRVNADGSDMKIIYPRGSGHPSMHPKLPVMVTDAYPHEPLAAGDGTSPIRLLDLQRKTETRIANIHVGMISDWEFRVDPHPVWDRTGRYVVFNGREDGVRSVYLADLGAAFDSTRKEPANSR